MVVDALGAPDTPVTVTVNVPVVAELLAVKVTPLPAVAGLVPKDAVTPLGKPDAERVTFPVNGLMSATVIVSLLLPPCATEIDSAAGASVKVAGAVTVSEIVVLAVSAPEVPETVTVDVPVDAALPAVKVTTLLPMAGLVPKAAATPAGRPDATSVTPALKGTTSAIEIVSVALLPCVTDRVGADGASEKLPDEAMVSEIVVLAVSAPEVPDMVTVPVPVLAEPLAEKVTTLLPVTGLVPKAAVTPLGRPDAARVTVPPKGLTSMTETVSLTLVPWVIDRVDADEASEKLPVPVEPPLEEPLLQPINAEANMKAVDSRNMCVINPIPFQSRRRTALDKPRGLTCTHYLTH